MKNEKEKNKTDQKSYKRRYKLTVGFISILIFASLIFILLTHESRPDPASEKVIREIAARILNKEPNDLNDEDFAQITEFVIVNNKLVDIKLLEKFTNLQKLNLYDINCPKEKIPTWMRFLGEHGVLDISEKYLLDLRPLKKLHNLKELRIGVTPTKDIKPLSSLINMNYLNLRGIEISDISSLKDMINMKDLILDGTYVSDLKPLSKMKLLKYLECIGTPVDDISPLSELTNIKYLILANTMISDIEPVKKMDNLITLSIDNTQVRDLSPLINLTSLKYLSISGTQVSNLEILEGLQELEILSLSNCPNISEQQVEDLQMALPNLKIEREQWIKK